MAPTLAIRCYRPADEPAVWAIHEAASRAVDAFVDPDGVEGGVATDPDRHAAGSRRLADEGVYLVGEHAGEVVATGALDPVDEGTAELTRMRVAPAHWRRGFGSRMLAALETRARARDRTLLTLETLARQTAARELYESSGFEETGRVSTGEFEVVTYRKQL